MIGLLACWPAGAQDGEPLAPSLLAARPAFESAPPDPEDVSDWRFDSALYAWLPGTFGSVEAQGRTANIGLSVGGVVDLLFDRWRALDGGGHFEAHRGRFDLFWDAVGGYVKPSTTATVERLGRPIQFDALATLHFVLAEFGLGYRVAEWSMPNRRRPMSIGLLAGARYYHLGTDITATGTGTLAQRDLSAQAALDWADPFVGIRYEVPVLDSVAFDFRGDIGGFGAGSQLSYSLVSLVRWWPSASAGTSPWLGAGYKLLAFDFEPSGNSAANLQLRGPWVGAGIEF
jgi:hypothetical protein